MNTHWEYSEARLVRWSHHYRDRHTSWEFTYSTSGHITSIHHNRQRVQFELYGYGPYRGLLHTYRSFEGTQRGRNVSANRFEYDATEAAGVGEVFVTPSGELLIRGARWYFSLSGEISTTEVLGATFPVVGDGSPERLPLGDRYTTYQWMRDCSVADSVVDPRTM